MANNTCTQAPAAPPPVLPPGLSPAAPVTDIADLWRRFTAAPTPDRLNQLATYYVPYLRAQAAAVAARLPRAVTAEDLEAAGHFGLLQAIRRFDRAKGYKFETYCAKRIRGAMYDYLRELDDVSRQVRVRQTQAELARDAFRKAHGYEPIASEVPPMSSNSTAQASPTAKMPTPPRTIRLADADLDSPLQRLAGRSAVLDAAQRADVKDYLTRRLSPRERLIVILIYFEGLTMKESGLTIGISESRISQLHQGILGKLRGQLHQRESELQPGV
jgi:RNA polymerase sigma factor for flagellar operon FliA